MQTLEMPRKTKRIPVVKSLNKKENIKIKNEVSSLLPVGYGSDPELMVFDNEKGKIVSSLPILKTDKNNPITLDEKQGIQIYADNILLEARCNPAFSHDEMIERFRSIFRTTQKYLGSRYKLVPQAAYEFEKDELNPAYGIDPMEIGCTPSYSGWKKEINNPNPFVGGIRTGSVHFHISNEKLTNFDTRIDAVCLLDVLLGTSFVIVDKDPTSKIRRKWYGQASEHRPTDYGLEYRVLSPYVIQSPELLKLALDIIDYSMIHIKNNTAKKVINLINPDMVINAINNCRVDLAEGILNKVKFPSNLMERVKKTYKPDFYKDWQI